MGAAMAELDLYFLRVWKRAQGAFGFRAAVKPLDGEGAEVFSDPERLAAYLSERASASATPAPATPAPASSVPAAPAPEHDPSAPAATPHDAGARRCR